MVSESGSSSSQLRKGALELACLGLIAQEPRFGAQLVDELAQRPGLAISVGTVYPLLARLSNSGLLEPRWQESGGGPPRKYYRLTPAGQQRLATLTQAWQELARDVNLILGELPA